MSSVFLVVKPSKIIFLISNTILQKEDMILLYIGYHSIPKENTTLVEIGQDVSGLRVPGFGGLGLTVRGEGEGMRGGTRTVTQGMRRMRTETSSYAL